MSIPRRYVETAVTSGALYAAADLDDPLIEIGEIDAPDHGHPWRVQIRLDQIDDVIAVLAAIRERLREGSDGIPR